MHSHNKIDHATGLPKMTLDYILGWQNSKLKKPVLQIFFGSFLGFINFYILLLFKLFLRHFTKKEAIKVTNKVRNGK